MTQPSWYFDHQNMLERLPMLPLPIEIMGTRYCGAVLTPARLKKSSATLLFGIGDSKGDCVPLDEVLVACPIGFTHEASSHL